MTARRGKKPKYTLLSEITAEQFAGELEDAVRRQIARLAFSLQPKTIFREITEPGSFSQIGVTAADLWRYAQTGDTSDWGDDSGALDAIQSIAEAVYSPAIGTFGVGELLDDSDPTTVVGVVLRAAHARYRIESGHAVTCAHLAAAASLALRTVRADATAGRLVVSGRDQVSAEEAQRWLAERGVPGYR